MAEAATDMTGGSQVLAAMSLGLQKIFLAATLVPTWEYVLVFGVCCATAIYFLLEFHIVGDILKGYRGDRIALYYNPKSLVATQVLSKCEVLSQRYWPTPWLSSPHFQTLFLHFFASAPKVDYQRQLYVMSDGGTVALDWVKPRKFIQDDRGEDARKNALDETPTAIVVPGLTSDSTNQYIKHICKNLSEKGWRVLVSNHRGLGGISMTSDQFYNAGFTDDLRHIVQLVHQTYPKSPLLAIGLSIGANILVKYLGEEGSRTPIGGAVAICCPWDLLVCDRFMARVGVQRLYNKALTIGLQDYAQLHHSTLARLIDWELLLKSGTVRDFDNSVTRHVGKYTTVDTYYRKCSSAQFIGDIAVPMLCINAKDDPICTSEAIPYDECRVNPNVVLGVTGHGGHLAYFEGLRANSIWWVRAVTEYAEVLVSSSAMGQESHATTTPSTGTESNIDKGPFLKVSDGLTATTNDPDKNDGGMPSPDSETLRQSSRLAEKNGTLVHTGASSPDGVKRLRLSLSTDDVDNVNISHRGQPLHGSVIQGSQTYTNRDGSWSPNVQHDLHPSVTIKLRSTSEVAALRSALSQLLDQVPSSSCSLDSTGPSEAESGLNSTPDTSDSGLCEATEVHVKSSVIKDLNRCVESARDLMESTTDEAPSTSITDDRPPKPRNRSEQDVPKQSYVMKDLTRLALLNRRIMWLVAYVALVTTFPLLSTALLVRTKGKLLDLLPLNFLKRRAKVLR